MDQEIASYPVPKPAAAELAERGFTILLPSLAADELSRLHSAYDLAIARAAPEDIRIRDSLRVRGLVNADKEFDRFYVMPPLLALARRVLGAPFKLSHLTARTILPGAAAQALHSDWDPVDLLEPKLMGFIVPLDDFSAANGATRFVPGSHAWGRGPAAGSDEMLEPVPALASAGSCIVFDARVWHGYGANTTGRPRCSIQGHMIRRDQKPSADHHQRVTAATRTRLDTLSRWILGID